MEKAACRHSTFDGPAPEGANTSFYSVICYSMELFAVALIELIINATDSSVVCDHWWWQYLQI